MSNSVSCVFPQSQLIECETVDGSQAGLVSCVDFWLTSFTELPHWHQDR